jgi:arsenate reductase
MDTSLAIAALSALAQATRLDVFRLLAAREPCGAAAGELARLAGVPQNTMSTHLATLSRAGLVRGERQSRSIVYRADIEAFRKVALFLLKDCCGSRTEICAPLIEDLTPLPKRRNQPMSDKIYNVLFLCTGNSARSILAESIMGKDGNDRFRAFSAGSQPKGKVNPFALSVLNSFGYPSDGARSKSWEEFAMPDAPVMDFVFTVCDSAAGESCPVWPGQPMTAHWGIEDPATVEGTDIQKEAAFVAAFRYLKNRISVFTNLPLASIDRLSLGTKLREIGRLDGSTSGQGKAS